MKKCVVCGTEFDYNSYANAALCSSKCFHEHFWNEYVESKDEPNIARISGYHYVVGDENTNDVLRGFGGRLFAIKFNDGRIVETTNLWSQGRIPDAYRDVLMDNAEFVKTEV